MVQSYDVRWTPEAEEDAYQIIDYFDDNRTAIRIIKQFEEKAKSLTRFPERGRIVPELKTLGLLQYHEIFHKPWRMIYTIRDQTVWITALLDARRKLADILYERLLRS